jgi:SEC-C motif-containing protein
MRSRYAAYALGLVDYVIKTQRPENRESRATLEQFCRETEFRGLEILEVGEKTVTFKALLFQNGKDCSFTEKSLFEKSGSTWIFIAPSSTA